VLLALSGLAGLLARGAVDPTGGRTVPLALPPGWASLVLTIAVAVLFPLLMAPLVLVTAAVGEVAPLLEVWPAALGGAVLGAFFAAVATLGLRGLSVSGRRVARLLQMLPPPSLAVGAVIAFGALAGAFELGPLAVLTLLTLVIGLQVADGTMPRSPTLSRAAVEAAQGLGAHPTAFEPPARPRSLAASGLVVAAETIGAGAAAFVVVVGLSHPLVIALSNELLSQRPAAAAAALSILGAVAILRGAAAWLARPLASGE
jgi:hypothetical protein